MPGLTVLGSWFDRRSWKISTIHCCFDRRSVIVLPLYVVYLIHISCELSKGARCQERAGKDACRVFGIQRLSHR